MKRVAFFFALISGCGPTDAAAPDLQMEDDYSGGSIRIAGCTYDIVTPEQATAPVPGSAVLGPDPTPRGIHLALPDRDAARTVAIVWQTVDFDTLATTVQYGAGGVMDHSADGYTFKVKLGPAEDRREARFHEVHLCGLEPGTRYTYRVGGKNAAGMERWSDAFEFRTAPPPGAAAPLSIGLIGDSRGNYDQWAKTLAVMASTASPDLILFSGDAVTLGSLQKEWDPFFDKAQAVLARVPMVFAHGNHEANLVNFYAEVAQPGDETNFGLDYGPLHLTVLNDTPRVYPEHLSKGRDFLEKDLAMNAGAPWRFVLHHQAMFSSATAHGSNVTLRNAWQPVIDMHGADMVLSGHDHDYERTLPLRGPQIQLAPTDGTTYVVSGGAGAELYTAGIDSWTAISRSTHNYVVIKLAGKMLDLKAYDDMNTVFDTFSYAKP